VQGNTKEAAVTETVGTNRDRTFMEVARALSMMAWCTHRNVGAVVVAQEAGEYRIVGHGYNKGPDRKAICTMGGCPRGQLPPGEGKNDYSDCISVHAEVMAMLMAGSIFCNESTLYVNSEPCFMCYRIAEGSGIARIVWKTDGESAMHERQLGKP
jgi:deoxycytidylate deaminase